MKPTAQQGDHVQVHYVKRFQDGTVASSRDGRPIAVVVGVDHPRLPGLGAALVGLAPGDRTTVQVPAERAYGMPDPGRVMRLARGRFAPDQLSRVGAWVQVRNGRGQLRRVRILEVRDSLVVIDSNHRRAGQAVELEVKLVGIEP